MADGRRSSGLAYCSLRSAARRRSSSVSSAAAQPRSYMVVGAATNSLDKHMSPAEACNVYMDIYIYPRLPVAAKPGQWQETWPALSRKCCCHSLATGIYSAHVHVQRPCHPRGLRTVLLHKAATRCAVHVRDLIVSLARRHCRSQNLHCVGNIGCVVR